MFIHGFTCVQCVRNEFWISISNLRNYSLFVHDNLEYFLNWWFISSKNNCKSLSVSLWIDSSQVKILYFESHLSETKQYRGYLLINFHYWWIWCASYFRLTQRHIYIYLFILNIFSFSVFNFFLHHCSASSIYFYLCKISSGSNFSSHLNNFKSNFIQVSR